MSEIAGQCEECGASVYKQHIDSGIARYEGGKMMCSHCVADYEKKHESDAGIGFEPIELEGGDDEEDVAVNLSSHTQISTTTAILGLGKAWDDSEYKRPLDTRAISATRCRTFHSKLSESSLQFMNDQINDWIDKDEAITVKFSTSTIGIFEGKHPEPNLILTIFY